MYTIILIDDESPALNELTYMLSSYQSFEIIGAYLDPEEGMKAIKKEQPDVVFLDISMPKVDGLTAAESLASLPQVPLIIFTTAFDQYAIKAFEVNAFDYVLKPVMDDRLEQTMNKIEQRLEELTIGNKTRESNIKLPNDIFKIPIWKCDRIYLVDVKDILYCSVVEGNTLIHSIEDCFISHESLNMLANQLKPYNFFRCHRSYLISLDKISEIIPWFNNTYVVKINGVEEEIPVSRRNIKEFKQYLHLS